VRRRQTKSYGDIKHMETAYVVKLHNFYQLAPAQPCFRFVHPNRSHRIDNSRCGGGNAGATAGRRI
jgi:hypothetical protein